MGRETDQHISDINIKAYLDERFKNSRDPSVGIALDLIKAMQMFTEDENNLVRNYLLRCVKGGADLDYAYVAIDVFRESPRQSDTEELLEMFLNGCSGWTQDFRARVAAALMRLKCTEALDTYIEMVDQDLALWKQQPCKAPESLDLLLDHLAYVSPKECIVRSAEFFAIGFQLPCKKDYENLARAGFIIVYTEVDPALIGDLIRSTRRLNKNSGELLKEAMLGGLRQKKLDPQAQTIYGSKRLLLALQICQTA